MAQFFTSMVTIGWVIHLMLLAAAYLILLERKLSAWIQDRTGPNRVGLGPLITVIVAVVLWIVTLPFRPLGFRWDPNSVWQSRLASQMNRRGMFGLGQPLADGIKFLFKEDYGREGVDRGLFILAPMLAVMPALLGWAVVPWGGYIAEGTEVWAPGLGTFTLPETVLAAAAPINIGVVYILAIGSLGVYGVVVGGYASNSKYSFLGGIRATAQMLSYEIPLGLCVLVVVLMSGTLRADWLVEMQANNVWNVFYHPLLCLIFFICLLAETNRAPFDLAEAEQELVAGYHTEYSAMKFALFFLGEYIHMMTAAAFVTLLFLGGWDLPFIQAPHAGGLGWAFYKLFVFAVKMLLLLSIMMWVRWTLPRLRFDQLMRVCWQALIPIMIVMLLATGVLVYLKAPLWTHTVANVLMMGALVTVGPKLPKGPSVNRRVRMPGSRFHPPTPATRRRGAIA